MNLNPQNKMHIAEVCQRRPIATVMFYISAILVGMICFQKLSVNFLPDISTPRLTIKTSYKNTTPDEVLRQITIPIEEAMNTLSGVKNIRSLTREGIAYVQVDFYWGTNMNYAFIDAREKLDRLKGQLPKEIERPTILKVDPSSEPIMILAISPGNASFPKSLSKNSDSTVLYHKDNQFTPAINESYRSTPSKDVSLLHKEPTARQLYDIADYSTLVLKRRIEQIEGVAQASIMGAPQKEIRIILNQNALNAAGLQIQTVAQELASQNMILSGGSIREGNYRLPLKIEGRIKTIKEVEQTVIGRTKDNRVIFLKDIATVSQDYVPQKGLTLWNGLETIQIAIRKEAGANTVETCNKIRRVLGDLNEVTPDLSISVVSDQSLFIERSIDDIISAIYFGAFLAFFVLFFFLNEVRYSIIIAITTPISIIITFILLYASGINLNIISLTGIAIGVGMLGDNVIIVIENVSRLRDEGRDRVESIREGVKEINLAAAASTFTNVAIFLPVIFTDGIAREIFRDMGLAMTFSLLSSLLIAITLVPALLNFGLINQVNLSTQEYDKQAKHANRLQRIRTTVQDLTSLLLKERLKLQNTLISHYEKMLLWILPHRVIVIVASLVLFLCIGMIGTQIPVQITPKLNQNEVSINLTYPYGYSIEKISESVKDLSHHMNELPFVSSLIAEVGDVGQLSSSLSLDDSKTIHSATLYLIINDGYSVSSAIEELRGIAQKESAVNGFQYAIQRKQTTLEAIFRPEIDDFSIKLIGNNSEDIQRILPAVEALVNRIDGVGDLRTGKDKTQVEYQLTINHDALTRYGVEQIALERFIQSATGGYAATFIQEVTEKTPISFYLETDRNVGIEELLSKRIKSSSGDLELRYLVEIRVKSYYAEVFRENGKNQLVLKANARESFSASSVASEIERKIIASGILPPDIRVEVGGENEAVKSSFKSLFIMLGLSLLLVFMILAAEFESLLYPFVIMLTSPLAAVGAILLMYFLGESYNALSLIGLVIMIGAVDNDAVIATDFIVSLRRKGLSQKDAIFIGISKRLRSIVMTTVTTVVGILPILFNVGSGSELGAAISTPLIGGVIAATIFTLVTIPAVFTFIDPPLGHTLNHTS